MVAESVILLIGCQYSQLVDLGISSSLQLRGSIIYYYICNCYLEFVLTLHLVIDVSDENNVGN